MSESPNATVTGSILATALAFKYRLLFPEFPRPKRTFSQRRALEKLSSGVAVFLHSKRGNDIYIGNRKKTTLSSRQACFVIAHSSGDLMIRIFKTIGYILLDYIVGENLNLNV